MDEELLRRYQEAITLLQFRHPGKSFSGDFSYGFDGKVALKLLMYNSHDFSDMKTIIFKYKESKGKAIMSFIKEVQNRVF